jgi:hypothetical protein
VDEDRLATLKHWGEGLAVDEREEVRAAGKAILMLVEEIEHLHVELWHLRMTQAGSAEESDAKQAPLEDRVEPQLDLTLTRRMRLLLRRQPL